MGTIHYYSAIVALFFGTWVLLTPKGTKRHKTLGLYYVIAMFIMLSTSLMSYRFNGSFNLFHIASIIATMTLYTGMLSIWFKRPRNSYLILHINFMYWSVIGLYMGLVAEIFTRIPNTPFYSMVLISSGTVFIIAALYLRVKKSLWENQFGKIKR